MMATPRLQMMGPQDFKRTPWKNGLGWTDQIAIFPPHADLKRGDFDWRVSTAQISQSADFSNFPDHDRVLVILQGAGVRLSHRFDLDSEPDVVDLPRHGIYEFPGDIPTRSDLVAGPIQDFSVFLRQGVVSATVEWLDCQKQGATEWLPHGQQCFLYVVEGSIVVHGVRVPEGNVLSVEYSPGSEPGVESIESDGARVLSVQIFSVS